MTTSPISLAGEDTPLKLQLIAACCDTIGDPDRSERVALLANQISDWWDFAQEVQRHQLLGSVAPHLNDIQSVPEELNAKWQFGLRKRASISLRQVSETVRLHRLLNDNGAENLVIKGAALGHRIYGSLIQKHSGDIDFVVRPEAAFAALTVLQDEGFLPFATGKRMGQRQMQAVARHYKEIALINDRKEMIDLHWRLVQHPAILKNIRPFEDTHTVPMGPAGSITTLSEANEFAYLCAHAALSDWRRLKWLSDLHAMLAQYDDTRIVELYEHANRLSAGRCVLQVLALREWLWATPMPAQLRLLLSDAELEELLAFATERLTTPYRPTSDRDRIERIGASAKAQRWLHPHGASAWAQLKPQLFALSDILALPLPPWLDWLYVPLRPFFWVKRQIFPDKLRQMSMRSYRPTMSDPPRGESQG